MCKISEDLHINIHWNKQTYLKWLNLSAQYWWKFQDHTIPGSKVILTYSTSIYILLWHFKRCFYHYKENRCAKFQKNDVNGCQYIRAGHSDRWPKGHGCIKTLPYLFCTAICPDTKRLSKFRIDSIIGCWITETKMPRPVPRPKLQDLKCSEEIFTPIYSLWPKSHKRRILC